MPDMELRLISHVNGDGDLLGAWFSYYRDLGVTRFHLIVHGPREENEQLHALKDAYPIVIEDAYEGPFDSVEKKRRLDSVLARLRGQWVLLVDSDEFVELPYPTIRTTIRMLRLLRRSALFAPMVQRLMPHGTLDAPEIVPDPFRTFPLCSVDLYQRMGVSASINKYPLFYCTSRTLLQDGGNHSCPIGSTSTWSLQGVTHHFKFRRSVSLRLDKRARSTHPWRQQSVQFQRYLDMNGNRLPTKGAFAYSRESLFRRGLLRKLTVTSILRYIPGAMGSIPGEDAPQSLTTIR
jgi:Glycosyl transferase family 2